MRLFKKKVNEKEIWFKECLAKYRSLDKSHRFSVNKEDFWKCLNDNTSNIKFDPHYTYHPAWAARCLARINPTKHIDISSILNFNVVLSAFVPTEFYDYRPAEVKNLSGLECKGADLNCLPFADNSVESLSCMHTVEHVGLGRYGDEIDPDADLRAISELKRVIMPGGNILFVVPIGKPRIQYNAHRVYSYDMIMEYFADFELVEYSLIPDNAYDVGIIINATREQTDAQYYACGCFWFKKIKAN